MTWVEEKIIPNCFVRVFSTYHGCYARNCPISETCGFHSKSFEFSEKKEVDISEIKPNYQRKND